MKRKLNLFVLISIAIDLTSISTDTEASAASIQQQIQALAAVRGGAQMSNKFDLLRARIPHPGPETR